MQYQNQARDLNSQREADFESLATSPKIELEREWSFPNLAKLIKEVVRGYDLSSQDYLSAKRDIATVLNSSEVALGLLGSLLDNHSTKQEVIYRALAICHFAEKGDENAQEFISNNFHRTIERGYIDAKDRVGPNDFDDLISVPLLAALRKIESLDPNGFAARAADILGRVEPPYEGEEVRKFLRRHEESSARSTLNALESHLCHSRRWGNFWSLGPLTYFFGVRTSL